MRYCLTPIRAAVQHRTVFYQSSQPEPLTRVSLTSQRNGTFRPLIPSRAKAKAKRARSAMHLATSRRATNYDDYIQGQRELFPTNV